MIDINNDAGLSPSKEAQQEIEGEKSLTFGLSVILPGNVLENPYVVAQTVVLGVHSLARKSVDFETLRIDWEPDEFGQVLLSMYAQSTLTVRVVGPN